MLLSLHLLFAIYYSVTSFLQIQSFVPLLLAAGLGRFCHFVNSTSIFCFQSPTLLLNSTISFYVYTNKLYVKEHNKQSRFIYVVHVIFWFWMFKDSSHQLTHRRLKYNKSSSEIFSNIPSLLYVFKKVPLSLGPTI